MTAGATKESNDLIPGYGSIEISIHLLYMYTLACVVRISVIVAVL